MLKRDFFRLFWKAFNQSFIPKNVVSGQGKTGLYSFKPKVVLNKYKPAAPLEEDRPLSSKSANLVLTAKDQRKTKKLLKEVVINTCDKRVRKLNDIILDLTTTNILLKYKLKGYERALISKKKKRQRGKALDFKLATPEDGRATFYSPNKIR